MILSNQKYKYTIYFKPGRPLNIANLNYNSLNLIYKNSSNEGKISIIINSPEKIYLNYENNEIVKNNKFMDSSIHLISSIFADQLFAQNEDDSLDGRFYEDKYEPYPKPIPMENPLKKVIFWSIAIGTLTYLIKSRKK